MVPASGGKAVQEVIVVLTTVPDEEIGRVIARALVDERLAACVSLLPRITSFYRWEDRMCEDAQGLLVIKTTRERLAMLMDRICELHTDTLPEVIALPVAGGLPAYLAWVTDEVGCPSGQGGHVVGR